MHDIHERKKGQLLVAIVIKLDLSMGWFSDNFIQ